MNTIIVTTQEALEEIVGKAVNNAFALNSKKEPEKLLTINQVAKQLHLSHSTIKKKVESGVIKSTKDGLITENAVNEYLTNKK